MRIDYTPTFADYWALNLFALKRQFRWFIYLPVLLLGLFFASPLLMQRYGQKTPLLEAYWQNRNGLIWPGLFGLVFVIAYYGARKRWSQLKELRDPRVYEFDDQGVHVKGESFSGSAEWSLVKEAYFTRKHVFLMTGQRQFYFFPVTAVSDLTQLRQLVAGKVPKVKSAS